MQVHGLVCTVDFLIRIVSSSELEFVLSFFFFQKSQLTSTLRRIGEQIHQPTVSMQCTY